MIPRHIIDAIFETIVNHDFVDRWNYPIKLINDFLSCLKKGEGFSPVQYFNRDCKFLTFNKISPEMAIKIFYPILIEAQKELVDSLLVDFDEFIIALKAQIQTNHAKLIFNNGNPLEDIGRHIVSAAVFGFFQKEGYVYHEVPSARGLIDILICTTEEIIIEAKLSNNFNPQSRQLKSYIKAGTNRRGYYFVFDITQKNSYMKHCDIENNNFPNRSSESIVVCHINPPRPSSI